LVESLSKGGLKSSLNWYLTVIKGINKGCVAPMASFLDAPRPGEITDESLLIKKPAFFGAAKKDYVCLYEPAVPHMEKHAVGGLKIVEFDTGHRLQLEQPENVNRELEVWIRDTFKL
jgi:soluble epoxide hydrolase/lipid-phosphate phosphatase